MKYIGAHVSVSGGVSNAPLNANAIGAKAFALFTGSNTRWVSKAISEKEAEKFKINCQECGFTPAQILPHDNYLINLGSPDPEKLEKSRISFLDEMKRCEILGLSLLNFHPGSHLNQIDSDACLSQIADNINWALQETSGVTAVLETTAGQGSNLGHRFEQIAHIIDRIEDKSRVGVCLDTCHSYSAGYDLRSPEGYAQTWQEFDDIIGRDYLKAIHLNDDLREMGSRIDRHASIGKGTLTEDFFIRFVNDPRFDNMPIILETPDDSIWAQEIKWLYSMITN